MSKHCDVCSLYLQNEYALQGHLAGKKHLKRLRQYQREERSVRISPLPKFIPRHELMTFLYQFGAIEYFEFSQSSLIIKFESSKSAEALLNEPIWLKNTKIQVTKGTINNDSQTEKRMNNMYKLEDTCLISYEKIKHVFDKETNFSDQLTAFLNIVQLSDTEIETKYESACMQLNEIFKVIFPKCKTHKFGSTQTGLCFKECDLDIYMDIGEPICETKTPLADSWTMQKIFKEVRKLMYRINYVFSNIILIPKAKTPIVKFCHVPTNISCDISFKSSLGIHKSHLIKYCISLDKRLKPLMMLIKYWARHFNISTSGRLSNYALILIIIFYLQQQSVNIIPPLMKLQEGCEPQIVDGWQVNFNNKIVLPPVENKNTIPELLHGFFTFYATFAFKSQVICLLHGTTHTKLEFKDVDSLPPCMDRYKISVKDDDRVTKTNVSKPMCVLDPIELSHNVTTGIQYSTLESFVAYCTLGAEICAQSSTDSYKSLMNILLVTVPNVAVTKRECKFIISLQRFQKMIPLSKSETSDSVDKKSKITKNNLYFTVFNIVKDIFEKVFKVKVEILTANIEKMQQKIEVLSDVHTQKHPRIKFHCVGNSCVWLNRKITNHILDPSLSCVEKEALMSDQVVENLNKSETDKINLDFTCIFEQKICPMKIVLSLKNQSCDNHVFHEFARFAKRKLHCIIHQTLMHMLQFNK